MDELFKKCILVCFLILLIILSIGALMQCHMDLEMTKMKYMNELKND